MTLPCDTFNGDLLVKPYIIIKTFVEGQRTLSTNTVKNIISNVKVNEVNIVSSVCK